MPGWSAIATGCGGLYKSQRRAGQKLPTVKRCLWLSGKRSGLFAKRHRCSKPVFGLSDRLAQRPRSTASFHIERAHRHRGCQRGHHSSQPGWRHFRLRNLQHGHGDRYQRLLCAGCKRRAFSAPHGPVPRWTRAARPALPVNIPPTGCNTPAAAKAYVFMPPWCRRKGLGFLTLWPDAEGQPQVSTLNALDGAVSSNMAFVTTSNGMVDAFASNSTHLVLHLFGYFAP